MPVIENVVMVMIPKLLMLLDGLFEPFSGIKLIIFCNENVKSLRPRYYRSKIIKMIQKIRSIIIYFPAVCHLIGYKISA
jgi:hypothetical protein